MGKFVIHTLNILHETFLFKENCQILGLGLLYLLSCQLSVTVLQSWI